MIQLPVKFGVEADEAGRYWLTATSGWRGHSQRIGGRFLRGYDFASFREADGKRRELQAQYDALLD